MPNPTLTIEINGFDELTRDIGRLGNLQDHFYWPLHDAMEEAVKQIEEAAKGNAPVAFGQLRASIGSRVTLSENEILGEIGTNLGQVRDGKLVAYAQAVEFGSRPHWAPIKPLIEWVRIKRIAGIYHSGTQRRIGNVRQQAREDIATAKRIQWGIARKGTKAQPFFFPAVEGKREDVMRLFEEAIDKVVTLFNQGGEK